MIQIRPISAFSDNYIWLVHDQNKNAIVVDPGDATPVLETIEKLELSLKAILVTHHHADHTGGISQLKAATGANVYASALEAIAGVDIRVHDDDIIRIEEMSLEFHVLLVPGHTKGHVAYFDGIHLFCGDTLFSVGCGRIFEGTPETMFNSLNRLKALPDETMVFAAHEYTQSNLKFALAVEPNNQQLQDFSFEVDKTRTGLQPTLPSSINLEKRFNPYFRCNQESVIKGISSHAGKSLDTELEVFTELRKWKDGF